MKNLLFFVLGVVCFFVLSNTAVAGGIKVPKELCMKVDDSTMVVMCLATKAIGSIKFADKQKVQYYVINGTYNLQGKYFPIGGTGYVSGDFFQFHIDSQLYGLEPLDQSLDGFLDLSLDSPAGSMTRIGSSVGWGIQANTQTLEVMPCSNISAPTPPVL